MNTTEGLRRIARAIRWIGYLLAAAILGVALFAFSAGSVDSWIMAAIAAIPAGGGWCLGWIIDGFAAPKDKSGNGLRSERL